MSFSGIKGHCIQVSGKIYSAMGALAQRSSKFGRSSAALAIGPLSDKLGDLKLKKPAGEALGLFAEKTSLGFVLSQGKHWRILL
jgi:cytoskeleton-associated protein 5